MHSGSHPNAGALRVLAVVGATRLCRMNLPTGQGTCLKDALEAKRRFVVRLFQTEARRRDLLRRRLVELLQMGVLDPLAALLVEVFRDDEHCQEHNREQEARNQDNELSVLGGGVVELPARG